MKQTKDNFSRQSADYRKYRPTYPETLYEWLFSKVNEFSLAWDCGTGNGQVAAQLATRCQKVLASDISIKQLEQAPIKPNIGYLLCRAEHTPLAAGTIDLVCVAQAIHWFDFKAFYEEVRRVAKPGALLAVWGYGLIKVSSEVDPLVQKLYSQTLAGFWDEERKYIDEAYQTISFPFPEIETPAFSIRCQWTFEQFMGYLSSWSAVQHFIRENGQSPLAGFKEELKPLWKEQEVKAIHFPVFMRVGRIVK